MSKEGRRCQLRAELTDPVPGLWGNGKSGILRLAGEWEVCEHEEKGMLISNG